MSALARSIACLAIALASPARAAPPAALFSSDAPIHITIQGPVKLVSRNIAKGPQDAILVVQGAAPERLAIRISPRGITRLKRDVCQFAPLRVQFAAPPPQSSLFAGQSRLKLVTHCRSNPAFQQNLLLEYSAYRLFNILTPASYRVRLASIDYVEPDGQPLVSRLGFFLEDIGDVGRRNGLAVYHAGSSIPTASLSARDAARVELFEYMISNYDWSLRIGPPQSECCHNAYLLGPLANGSILPVPYDFDFSGLVDAPYAVPPDVVPIRRVTQRRYRGFCMHNADAVAVAPEFRAKRADLLSLFNLIPQMDERTRARATGFLATFFDDIRDDSTIRSKLLPTCFN